MTIGAYIMAVIEWAVVPLVLAGILLYTIIFIPDDQAIPRVKTSAQAGKWAGLIVFVIYVISRRSQTMAFSLQPADYDFVFWPTAAAVAAGFAVSAVFDLIRSTRFLGLLVLALVSATSISLYSYLFIRLVRNSLVFVLLGFVLGVLLYEVFFPDGMPEAWGRALRGKRAPVEPALREQSGAGRDDREHAIHR